MKTQKGIKIDIVMLVAIISLFSMISICNANIEYIEYGECTNYTTYSLDENDTVTETMFNLVCSKEYNDDLYQDTIYELRENISSLRVEVAVVKQENEDIKPLVSEYKSKYQNSENKYNGINQRLANCNADKMTAQAELGILNKNPVIVDTRSCSAIGMVEENWWTKWGVVAGALLLYSVYRFTSWIDSWFVKKKKRDEEDDEDEDEELTGLNV